MRATVIFSFLILTALPCFGQGSFIIENYSYKDYNAHRQNWAITQDTSGRILFGNNNSLIWFDGVKWFSKHISNNSIIRSLKTSSDGKVYYGTVGDFGLLEYDSLGKLDFRSLKTNVPDSLAFEDIYQIQEHDSALYFQSYKYIFKYYNESVTVIKNESSFSQLSKAGDHLLVRLIGSGLYYLQNDTLKPTPDSEYFAEKQFFSAEDLGDHYLLTSRYSGLSLFDGESITPLNNELSILLANSDLYRTERINEHQIAFATISSGIIIANIDEWSYQTFEESHGLAHNQVHEVFIDHTGVLWAVGENGISRILVNHNVHAINAVSGLPGNIMDVKLVDDYVYIATSNRLYSWNDSTNELKMLPIYFPNSMTVFNKDLIVSSIQGLHHIERNEIKTVSNKYNFRQIIGAEMGSKKLLVAVNENGLTIMKLSKDYEIIEETKSLEKLALSYVGLMDSSIWGLSSWGDVIKFDTEGKEVNRFNMNLPEGAQIRAIGKHKGKLFVGTDVGMFSLTDAGVHLASEINRFFKQGVESTKQFFRFETCDNQLFVYYNRRIIRFDGNKVHESPYQLIGEEEEINSIECVGDDIWFGGNAGIYILGEFTWNYHTNFKTNITSFFTDSDSLIYGGFGIPSREIVLPYSLNELRFNFAATSYIDSERNTYSYKLAGFDADWSNWSLESQKDYTNIPEGDYLFQVKSKNVYGVEGSTDTIAFTILPPWYRTWWAYLFYLFSTLAIMYLAYRIRVQQLLKVERMRTKIASDLHDEVSATLTGISYFAEAVKTDINADKKDHFMNLITESAGDAKDKITDIVWSISPENDDWVIFLSKCRRYASDLVESRNLKYDFRIAERIPGKLDMYTRQHLWMIFKEMITNAVRHSKGTRLDLIMDVEDGIFKMIIQDNGVGFDISSKAFGNGLNNIRKRANLIKAKLELDSEKELGTRWRLEIKL